MKRSKSGAQKRKEAAAARDAVAKLPKMTDFFKITEQSRPGTSTRSRFKTHLRHSVVFLGKTLYGTFPCLVVLTSSSKLQ